MAEPIAREHPDVVAHSRPVAVRLAKVSKTFGGPHGIQALDQVTFVIREREFVAIVGPSGCGKSTLLRIIAGLTPHEGEEVSIFGCPVAGPSTDVGVVFQTSNLLPWLSVARNVRLAAEIRGLPKASIDAKLEELLAVLGLTDFSGRHPHELSGGMQQRAALGQVLMLSPRILLLDEPFGALDALTRDRLNLELLNLWEAQRQTALLITHSIAEAVFLSDRIFVMSARPGRLIEEIAVDLPRPRHPRKTREMPRFGHYVGQLSEIMGVG